MFQNRQRFFFFFLGFFPKIGLHVTKSRLHVTKLGLQILTSELKIGGGVPVDIACAFV